MFLSTTCTATGYDKHKYNKKQIKDMTFNQNIEKNKRLPVNIKVTKKTKTAQHMIMDGGPKRKNAIPRI